MTNSLNPIQTARKALIDAQQNIAADRAMCDDTGRVQWDNYQNAISALSQHEAWLTSTREFNLNPTHVQNLAEEAGLIKSIDMERTSFQMTDAPEVTPLLQRFAHLLLETHLSGRPADPPEYLISTKSEPLVDGTDLQLCRLLAEAGFEPSKVAQLGELPVFRNLLYLAETWKERREILVKALANGVLENLNSACHCLEGYKSRNRIDPQCEFCNTNAGELRDIAGKLIAGQLEQPVEPLMNFQQLHLAIQEVIAHNKIKGVFTNFNEAVAKFDLISRPLAVFTQPVEGNQA